MTRAFCSFWLGLGLELFIPLKTRTEINLVLNSLVNNNLCFKIQEKRQNSLHKTRTKTKSFEIMNVNITPTAFL